MKRDLGFGGILGSVAIGMVIVGQPAQALPTQITDVQVNSTDSGVEVVLKTGNGDRPQVFTVNRGNAWVADVTNTQLQLSGGNGFVQNNPAPGITSVSVTQLDANSVRVVVTGESDPPSGEIATRSNGLVLAITPSGAATASAPSTATPASPTASSGSATAAPSSSSSSPSSSSTSSPSSSSNSSSAAAPNSRNFNPDTTSSNVMVPNPGVTIDGIPVLAPSPAFVPSTLPAPVPPPVGDIATSSLNTAPSEIDLGTSEVVPRLVLRDAPVRDVLSLLARAAGLNVAYVDNAGQEGDAAAQGGETESAVNTTISLDIENEPVQNVFNYVIRITGLDVNRVGRTIFVGPRLPSSARQVIARTLRLNQVSVDSAVTFLVGLGAETAVTQEQTVTTVTAAPVTTEGGITTNQQTQQSEQRQEVTTSVQRVEYTDSDPLLRGLQVIGDQRTNSVTLVGTPRQIELAAAQLSQLDVRRRQAAINVRVIDVNLLGIDRFSTSFSFGIDDTRVIQNNGVGVINFGTGQNIQTPVGVTGGVDAIGTTSALNPVTNVANNFDFVRNFLGQLQMAVTSGNAKILTDPTLVVQEGQTAQVQLTQDVITNFEIETDGIGQDQQQTVTVERTPAGLILDVQVDRIDDNGFVSLSVAPAISAPTQTTNITVQGSTLQITLLSVRRVSSGQIRIRDGQTLILSGIIQDQDRADVTKIPILGDIPILGALFRSVNRRNQRQEVIVMLTPHILDDSDASTFGYRYSPMPETQDYIREQNIQAP